MIAGGTILGIGGRSGLTNVKREELLREVSPSGEQAIRIIPELPSLGVKSGMTQNIES